MENAENPFVHVQKIENSPKRWLPNGRHGFYSSKTTPHLL